MSLLVLTTNGPLCFDDVHLAANVLWVPKEARWRYLLDNARLPQIGTLVDEAMLALEKENTRLKGALSKDYARPALDKTRLGGVIDLIGNIKLHNGDSQDILGLVYEYFLSQFASKEGKKGGELLKDDVRWQFGVPPTGNANYAWIQHTAAPLFGFFMIILYITLYLNNQESRKDHPL